MGKLLRLHCSRALCDGADEVDARDARWSQGLDGTASWSNYQASAIVHHNKGILSLVQYLTQIVLDKACACM